jgi:hypothetical protein
MDPNMLGMTKGGEGGYLLPMIVNHHPYLILMD